MPRQLDSTLAAKHMAKSDTMNQQSDQTNRFEIGSGRTVTHSSQQRKVWGSILEPVTSNSAANALHRCNISSKGAVLPKLASKRR